MRPGASYLNWAAITAALFLSAFSALPADAQPGTAPAPSLAAGDHFTCETGYGRSLRELHFGWDWLAGTFAAAGASDDRIGELAARLAGGGARCSTLSRNAISLYREARHELDPSDAAALLRSAVVLDTRLDSRAKWQRRALNYEIAADPDSRGLVCRKDEELYRSWRFPSICKAGPEGADSRPTAPAEASDQSEDETAAISGDIVHEPLLQNIPNLVAPSDTLDWDASATCTISLTVTRHGKPEDIFASCSDSRFAGEAYETGRRTEWSPAHVNGVPVRREGVEISVSHSHSGYKSMRGEPEPEPEPPTRECRTRGGKLRREECWLVYPDGRRERE